MNPDPSKSIPEEKPAISWKSWNFPRHYRVDRLLKQSRIQALKALLMEPFKKYTK